MSRAKLDFLLSSIELNLSLGRKPLEAVEQAVEAYKSVYIGDGVVDTPPIAYMDESTAYEWAGRCLQPLQSIGGLVESHRLQQVADKIASAIMDAARVSTTPLQKLVDGITPSTHEAIADNWMCTHCEWNGHFGDTMGVMYRGVDWQQCPVCRSVVIPSTGSTRYIGG